MGGGTLWQMKACVIPGNAFSRDMNLEKNYGLPRWIPKNTSQVKSSARLGFARYVQVAHACHSY